MVPLIAPILLTMIGNDWQGCSVARKNCLGDYPKHGEECGPGYAPFPKAKAEVGPGAALRIPSSEALSIPLLSIQSVAPLAPLTFGIYEGHPFELFAGPTCIVQASQVLLAFSLSRRSHYH